MHRKINQINVSITTNRGCNLRCDHCYIMPHVFKDPARMTMEHARLLFDRVEELLDLDQNLEEVEWEAIGGETTLMPFEWWDEMLPFMLERVEQVNRRLRSPGSLNFLTNMMIRDERYFDLFNRFADHPAFCIYTSWEPDTRRFGSRNKLFPKFLENLDRLKVPNLILDIIMTKEVCDLGGQWIVDTFVPHGVTDFSCKMLSPYGSGKKFFETAMVDFAAMSRFLAELDDALPAGITYTPSEEALSSLYRGSSFQCNGNFYYDLSIEPDGLTHFNANQTADEMVTGGMRIHLDDPDWARKVILGNAQEAAGKLGLHYPECNQCEYLRFCNAGWWHYKSDPELVAPFRAGECAGLKQHWDRKARQIGGSRIDISALNHRVALRDALTGQDGGRSDLPDPPPAGKDERDIPDLASFLRHEPADGPIRMSPDILFDRSPSERLIWYDALGITVEMAARDAERLPAAEAERILTWQAWGVLRRALPFAPEAVHALMTREDLPSARLIQDAAAILRGFEAGPDTEVHAQRGRISGLVVDARNDELFRWLLLHPDFRKVVSVHGDILAPDPAEVAWLRALEARLRLEKATRQRTS